jgi:hypothetical protein
MYTTYFWHKCHIYRAKITAILLLVSISYCANAQSRVYNRRFLEHYDDKPTHFGFYFGTGFSRLNVEHNQSFSLSTDETVKITSKPRFAFKVGLVVNRYLSPQWDLRTTPGINISSKELHYDIYEKPSITDERDLDYFELPILAKFKSDRRKNHRMYMLAGANFLIETNIRKGQKALVAKLPTKNSDFCIEYGAGFEQFLEFGKFSGELRFSHGLRNLLVADSNKPHAAGLAGLKSHTVTIYLFFE